MTSTEVQPSDVRLQISVFLEPGERYDIRFPDGAEKGFQEYGEVRLVVFTSGSPTATEYVAKRRKRTGEVLASASPRDIPVHLVPEQVRRAARMTLLNADFPLEIS